MREAKLEASYMFAKRVFGGLAYCHLRQLYYACALSAHMQCTMIFEKYDCVEF